MTTLRITTRDAAARPDAAPAVGAQVGRAGSDAEPLLRVRGVSKRFGQLQVLTDVGFDVPAGQVTALVGDNGAGKSVLLKCLSGIYRPDAGGFVWAGSPVSVPTPAAATALGIETVYQDLALCDNLDIVQNLYLGRERHHGPFLDEGRMERETSAALDELNMTTIRSLRQKVGSLSGGQRQAVAIAKALLWESKLVIMDEPTAALGVAETTVVLDLIRRLADHGVAVIVVSHNMQDVFRVADRLVVLYLGRVAAAGSAAEMTIPYVVELMSSGSAERRPPGRPGQPTSRSSSVASVRTSAAVQDAV